MIEIKKLIKKYQNNVAVNDISLNVKKGEIFGFIGPNGAGKSTTIRCILKLVNKTKGKIYIEEKDIDKSEKYKNDIGYLPSEVNLYKNFKVKEMFDYTEKLYKSDCKKRIYELVQKLDIDLNKKIGQLSYGNLKKVGIVIALMNSPKILILDEPTNGLDPLKQKVFFEILMEEKKKGTTIFFSSHNLEEVQKVSDRIGIIKNGKIISIQDKLSFEDKSVITLQVENLEFEKIKKIAEKLIEYDENSIKFIYAGDINKLLKLLAKMNIVKINIEKLSIDDIFIEFYEEKNND